MRRSKRKKYLIFRKYFYYFFVYSFCGWLYEVSWFLIYRHRFVNRGFFYGPFLPIYGIGGILILLTLRKINSKYLSRKKTYYKLFINFIVIILLSTILEYVSHYILDEYFNVILWSYRNNKFNLNGRICLETSLKFGLYGTLFFTYMQPLLDILYKSISNKVKDLVLKIILVIFIIDLVFKIIS